MTDATVVLNDRVERITRVRTIAADDWRAALVLHGEFDVATAPELAAELSRHLEAGRRVIRVDVGRVEFMDSAAIGELIKATERCTGDRGSLILTNVPPRLWRVLAITGFDKTLLLDTAANHGRTVSA